MLTRWRRSRRSSTTRGRRTKKVSLADLITCPSASAAIERPAKPAGHNVQVPFTPDGPTASQEQTDVESVRDTRADTTDSRDCLEMVHPYPAEHLLIERASG